MTRAPVATAKDGAGDRPPLGPLSLLTLGLNGIVGVGIFVAPPTVAAALPGRAGAWLYLAIAIACLPVALIYARLARAMPRDGGPTLWAARAFGPQAASAIGVLIWVSSIFSTAAVTRALADRLAELLGRPALAPALAVVITVALLGVNLRGLRPSAIGWTLLTALKLAPLAVVAALGAMASSSSSAASATPPTSAALGRAMLAILFALQGFEIVPLPAGQARDPARSVPRATIAALLLAGALYAAIHHGCAVALPALATSTHAIPDAARALGGPTLARAVDAGVLASIGGIVVGMHAMTPRYLTAVIAPDRAGPVDPRAIALSAAVVAPFAAVGSLGTLVDLSSAAVLAQYAATACAAIALAARRREGMRPVDAWPTPFALAMVVVLLSRARPGELLVAASVALVGGAVAALLRRREGQSRAAP